MSTHHPLAHRLGRLLQACLALLAVLAAAAAEPSYRVTRGSLIEIAAEDLSLDAFRGNTRAFLMNGRKVVNLPLRIAKDGDGAGTVASGTWKTTIPPGRYTLHVETGDADGARRVIKVTDFLIVAPPAIHAVSSFLAAEGEQITISGNHFGNPCTVWMGRGEASMAKCAMLTRPSAAMDPRTGESSVTVTVPKGVGTVDGAVVRVANRIGADTETVDAHLAAAEAVAYAVTVGDIHETSRYLPELGDFIATFKATQAGRTVALNAGDMLSAYARKSYDPAWARDLFTADPQEHGVAIMAAIAAIPFDAVALGNHDPCLGLDRLRQLQAAHPLPLLATNLFRLRDDPGYTPWGSLTDPPLPDFRTLRLKGLDVGIVATAATEQDHWTNADKSTHRVVAALDERTMATLRECALRHDLVILVTHQNDVSDIIPVYGPDPQPTGEYRRDCDIYTLKDLANVALILGGHEHKNYFRRADYDGDNATYALYIDTIYRLGSKLALVKSSKFFGEYAGVVRIRWDKASRSVAAVDLMEGLRNGDGTYLGCADDQMAAVDDGGLLQELAEDPWDPAVPTRWWRMDDWPVAP
jgi:hypothetical protein